MHPAIEHAVAVEFGDLGLEWLIMRCERGIRPEYWWSTSCAAIFDRCLRKFPGMDKAANRQYLDIVLFRNQDQCYDPRGISVVSLKLFFVAVMYELEFLEKLLAGES